MVQNQNLKRRIEKVERKLEPEKGKWLRWPDGKGGFIEVPGCRTLLDVVAMCMASKRDKGLDETERN